jgi:hypothetical protein
MLTKLGTVKIQLAGGRREKKTSGGAGLAFIFFIRYLCSW